MLPLHFAPRLQCKRGEGGGRNAEGGWEDALVDPRDSGLLACLDVAQSNELCHHRPPLALALFRSACRIAASRRPRFLTLVASAPVVSTHECGAPKRAAPATAAQQPTCQRSGALGALTSSARHGGASHSVTAAETHQHGGQGEPRSHTASNMQAPAARTGGWWRRRPGHSGRTSACMKR